MKQYFCAFMNAYLDYNFEQIIRQQHDNVGRVAKIPIFDSSGYLREHCARGYRTDNIMAITLHHIIINQ